MASPRAVVRDPLRCGENRGTVPSGIHRARYRWSHSHRDKPTWVVFLMTNFIDTKGNLLESDVEGLVNTVNTVGVMGKGIALQFKNAFPANYKAYAKACKRRDVNLGKMFVFDNGRLTPPRWIVNFPTKDHWRSRSRIGDVAAGLDDLRHVIIELRRSHRRHRHRKQHGPGDPQHQRLQAVPRARGPETVEVHRH